MERLLRPMRLFILGILLLTGCTQAAQPSVATEPKSPAANVPREIQKAAWEEKWANVLAEAKKEGKVVVYSLWKPDTRQSLSEAFYQKYGIIADFVPFGRGAELLAKIQMEKVAGLKVADIYGAGGPTIIGTIKPEGFLGNSESLLILPEVLQSNAWRGASLPFLDKDKTTMGLIATPFRFILINTDMVKPGEVTTYQDLLNPKYKEKIVFNDPSVTGVGNGLLGHLAKDIWNEDQALAFLKDILRQQPIITRDYRLQVEWVARGKNPIGLAADAENVASFLDVGSPLSLVKVKEGVFVSPGGGAFAMSAEPQHPKATQLFINWLLTKEGQTAFVKGFGSPSTRLDVPLEGINPLFIPAPEEKIFLDSEEHILIRAKLLKSAADIMAAAGK